jgi:hypothetical protein
MTNITYRSRAVRALVLLHDEHLRRFLQTWKRAHALSVALPATDDPAYASLDNRAARLFGHFTRLQGDLTAAQVYFNYVMHIL